MRFVHIGSFGLLVTTATAGLISQLTSLAQVDTLLDGAVLGDIATEGAELEFLFKSLANSLTQVLPRKVPTSIPEVFQTLQNLLPGTSNNPAELFHLGAAFLFDGLAPADVQDILTGYTSGNDIHNVNPIEPSTLIYPRASPDDPTYSLPEAQLRQALHIPGTFTYGKNGRMPLLMVPGTATPGRINFAGNFYKLLKDSPLVDPVWLNVPDASQQDAQLTAELIAYNAHYLHSISGSSNVTILTWSQGGLDAQWALKYWQSLHNFVSDLIAMSPDYHGTLFSDAQCALFPRLPCPPGARQQRTDSTFISTLHNTSGDSAYIPTTNVYSAFFDEIVIPQANPNASAFLNDVRDVGVLNAELQSVCNGQPAGLFYTHEGVLYNNLAFELFLDAVKNPGPASLDRIDLPTVCSLPVTSGLGLADVLATEGIIPVAAILILNATNLSKDDATEPEIKEYAFY